MTAMATDDPYDLQRFVTAQDADGTYQHALAELRAGRKTSHWMWFVFPQIAGLGYSPTSRIYAITSLAEARRYLASSAAAGSPAARFCTEWPAVGTTNRWPSGASAA